MEITEIRIKLMESSEDRLRAFCSITIDGCFVVRDLKIIDGSNGPFVAMPSRKLTGHCGRCHHKNHLKASYCNHCGNRLHFDEDGALDSPQKLYADVAHPINSECRERIQSAVIREFDHELDQAKQPGYRSRYDDDFSDAGDGTEDAVIDSAHQGPPPPKMDSIRSRSQSNSSAANSSAANSSGVKSPAAKSTSANASDKQADAERPAQESESTESSSDSSADDGGFGAGIFE